jgi:hypothetical protein
MKQTGGVWDPTRWPLYFMAANLETLNHASLDASDNLLCAVNDLMEAGKAPEFMDQLIARGRKVFLDSGVYWLATQHAEANHLSMDEALGLAPEKISRFDELFGHYTETVQRYEQNLWGYIEIDQGGRENKKRTRAKLEAMGLRPIPVYHPFNDGWDYFDELASQYDRICLGNVVMASSDQRKRLLATVWERRRKYPHLWIHALGLTPNETCIAYPMNSCDSSAWISNVRYGHHKTTSTAQAFGELVDGFIYARDADPHDERGHVKARRLCAYDAIMLGRTLRKIRDDLTNELGADVGLFADHYN